MASAGKGRWGFIGAGQMATALARGLIRAGAAAPEQIVASDPSEAAQAAWVRATGAAVVRENVDVVARSDVIVLAVKPQILAQAMAALRPALGPQHLVVSVVAGATTATLAAGLDSECRIIRVMPNTPALVGAGAAGYCLGPNATADDEELVRSGLESTGVARRVSEPLLDAVTGLSGSGPAFVYAIIEALSDGGVRVGLPRDVATTLAAQTVAGAAQMVLQTGLHPGVLKDQVTSPGGTTIAGLHALERGALRATLMDAVQAAAQRAAELGQGTAGKA